ncbi:MAG: hypothetical protein KQH63_05575 [Desulfobulbaceae bacterium]|nr:hypothetical protein [Desulfobulbaceae bacterium]
MEVICLSSVVKWGFTPSRLLKNVASEAETRKNEAKKRSLHGVNEHFEPNFDAVSASAVVFQQPAKGHEYETVNVA